MALILALVLPLALALDRVSASSSVFDVCCLFGVDVVVFASDVDKVVAFVLAFELSLVCNPCGACVATFFDFDIVCV